MVGIPIFNPKIDVDPHDIVIFEYFETFETLGNQRRGYYSYGMSITQLLELKSLINVYCLHHKVIDNIK